MSIIKSFRTLSGEEIPFYLRVWIWCTAVFVTVLMLTPLVNWIIVMALDIQTVSPGNTVKHHGLPVNRYSIAWIDWKQGIDMIHLYVCYCLCFLCVVRILIELYIHKEQKILYQIVSNLVQSPGMITWRYRCRFVAIKVFLLIFFFILVVVAMSGIGLSINSTFNGINSAQLSDIHRAGQLFLYLYAITYLVIRLKNDRQALKRAGYKNRAGTTIEQDNPLPKRATVKL